jgi:glycosyltransferase involved in cell wall biosynthesis
MATRRYTFVMEQTLGHIPFSQNIRKAFDEDNSVGVTWLKVEYPYDGWLEKLPVLSTYWSLRGSLKARRLIQNQNKLTGHPDLYLFHTQVISLLSAGWLRDKVPVIISLDATPLNYDLVGKAYGHRTNNLIMEKFKFWLNRRVFHKANYLITWSEWARQSLINDYGVASSRVEVIPPGTDLEFWQRNLVNHPVQNQGKLIILFVGSDFERKGGQLLYNVFRKNFTDRYELHLVTKSKVTAGDGVFVYPNIQPNSYALQELYSKASVFVLPTRGDCLPVAITEAMAAGLPIISTRVGAIEEAVSEGENGYLIPPDDENALTCILERLANSPEIRNTLGTNSRKRAEKYFDASKNGRRLLEVCKKLSSS